MSEALNDLPELWEWTKLGDVITQIIGGGTPSKSTAKYWEGDIPWLTIKDMRTRRPTDTIDHITQDAVDESSTNLIPADTVIMATRVGLGKVVRVPYATTINQDLKALITPPELDKSYLEYWLVFKAHYLDSIGSGTTVKGIRLEQVRSLDFPFAPTEQQKRIVAKIEELFSHIDAGIAALNKSKQLLKQYRQSVLKAAVTGELTKQWREENKDKLEPASELLERILIERRTKWEEAERVKLEQNGKFDENSNWKEAYVEPVKPMECDIAALPSSWSAFTLDTFTAFTVDYRGKTPPTSDEGIQVISAANVKKGEVVVKKPKLISEKTYKEWATRGLPEPNDLIVTTEAPVGEVALYPEEGIYQLTRRVFACKLVCIEPKFALNWFLSQHFQDYLKPFIRGTTVPRILKPDLMATPLPAIPVKEQLKIIEILENKLLVISRTEVSIEFKLAKAIKNKQAILATAFSGDLVKQLASDRSAKELLDDIAKEADDARKKAKRNKTKTVKKKVKKLMIKRSLLSVLEEAVEGISPENLMQEAGFLIDEVDEFYQELSKLLDQLDEVKLKESDKKNWPYDSAVKLKLKDK